jgi:hypothetical protein
MKGYVFMRMSTMLTNHEKFALGPLAFGLLIVVRDVLIWADLDLWKSLVMLGVGVAFIVAGIVIFIKWKE